MRFSVLALMRGRGERRCFTSLFCYPLHAHHLLPRGQRRPYSGGVFLVRSNRTTTRVDTYKTNKPSQHLFMVPVTLTAGTYRLEVRSKLRGSDNLRTWTLAATLTVA